jgi:pyruvate,water dikinase
MFTRSELIAHVRDGAPVPDDLVEREQRYLDLSDCIPPFVIAGSVAPAAEWPRHSTAPAQESLAIGESLTGLSGSPGVVRGPAKLVGDPRDPFAIEEGDVIVVPITDPAWTPLFLAAGGVVSDVGASVSHAAIVSRELGIPCVVSATGATERITDGMVLEVDGAAGVVRRVS